jgi:hypothetical protein
MCDRRVINQERERKKRRKEGDREKYIKPIF